MLKNNFKLNVCQSDLNSRVQGCIGEVYMYVVYAVYAYTLSYKVKTK